MNYAVHTIPIHLSFCSIRDVQWGFNPVCVCRQAGLVRSAATVSVATRYLSPQVTAVQVALWLDGGTEGCLASSASRSNPSRRISAAWDIATGTRSILRDWFIDLICQLSPPCDNTPVFLCACVCVCVCYSVRLFVCLWNRARRCECEREN